jgi:hypothetical protein
MQVFHRCPTLELDHRSHMVQDVESTVAYKELLDVVSKLAC